MLPLQADHPPRVHLPVPALQRPVSELAHGPMSECEHLASVGDTCGVVRAAGNLSDSGSDGRVRSVLDEGFHDARALEALRADPVAQLTLRVSEG
jgi:hypothetical protein